MIGGSLLLSGCGSQMSAVNPSAPHQSALRAEPVIKIVQPDPKVRPFQYEFRQGSRITVEGNVNGVKSKRGNLWVRLFWGVHPIAAHLIHAQSIAVTSTGKFHGIFDVPQTSFVGASGGEFVMEITSGSARPVLIHLAIPATYAIVSQIIVIHPDPKVYTSDTEFKPGGEIAIEGRVHNPVPAMKALSVQLFWAAPNIHHLIRTQTFAIQSNGNFAGAFKVPKGGFVGGGGGQFTLEFSYGNAKSVDVQLVIPAVSAAK